MPFVLIDWARVEEGYQISGVLTPEKARLFGWLGPRPVEYGVPSTDPSYRTVRPLLISADNPYGVRRGWSAWLLDRAQRWDVFDLVQWEAAEFAPPFGEDVWVRALPPRKQSIDVATRRLLLELTASMSLDDLFGFPLQRSAGGLMIPAGVGTMAVRTVLVPSSSLRFFAEPGVRSGNGRILARLLVEGLEDSLLPVRDHVLLSRAERDSSDQGVQADVLSDVVRHFGDVLALRLGLTRPTAEEPWCFLTLDGVFSLSEPGP